MRIITIIGARPQFVKAAIVSHYIRVHNAQSSVQIDEAILHTGQHYDYSMSQVFFDEMHLPAPTWHLGCSSRVDEMRDAIVPLIRGKADYVMVYGDTNSTLAGALAAEICNIPLIHVEAGLRSFNAAMAEEYNRIETDKRAKYLFCPTRAAVRNLANEGIVDGVYHVGDVMYDATLLFGEEADRHSGILEALGIGKKGYYLATIHRAQNTDNIACLASILDAFARIKEPIILPLHPRTRKVIEGEEMLQRMVAEAGSLRIIDSVSYMDMLVLEKHAIKILTDSGGVQKEAYFHRTACVTMRNETEWVETVKAGWNRLVGTDTEQIVEAVNRDDGKREEITEYGSGDAAKRMIDILCRKEH